MHRNHLRTCTLAVSLAVLSACDSSTKSFNSKSSKWVNGYQLEKILTLDSAGDIVDTKEFNYSADGSTVGISYVGPLNFDHVTRESALGATSEIAFNDCSGTVELNDAGAIVRAETEQPGCSIEAVSDTEVRFSSGSTNYQIDPEKHQLVGYTEYSCTTEFIYSHDNSITEIHNHGTESDCVVSDDTVIYDNSGRVQQIDHHSIPESISHVTEINRYTNTANVTRHDIDNSNYLDQWFVTWDSETTQILTIENVPHPTEPMLHVEIFYDNNGNPVLQSFTKDGEIAYAVKFIYSRSLKPVPNIALTLLSESVVFSNLD